MRRMRAAGAMSPVLLPVLLISAPCFGDGARPTAADGFAAGGALDAAFERVFSAGADAEDRLAPGAVRAFAADRGAPPVLALEGADRPLFAGDPLVIETADAAPGPPSEPITYLFGVSF